jgi:solute carrier family 44 protein 1 (choline transporter-like protein)
MFKIEKNLDFLNFKNIYNLLLAIYGDNFCRSGQQAFKMITSNVLRVAAINSVGDFVLFLGKVLVVTSTVLLGFKMLEVYLIN